MMHPLLLSSKYAFVLAVLFLLHSCASSFNKQTSDCFDDYSTRLDACNGDENCESSAVSYFQSCIGFKYVFPINFVVLTDSLTGSQSEIKDELEAVVDSLNKYFTVQDNTLPPDNRRRVISFTFKSATYFSDAIDFGGDLVNYAQPNFNFDTRHDFKEFVNDPANSDLVADDAINIFIVDCWGTNKGNYKDISSSHAKNNDNHPYIVIDYARITGKADRSAVEEHEMGHCFKLAHICESGTTKSSSTNIMTTTGSYPVDNSYEYISGAAESNCADDNPGDVSIGKRDIGFNSEQCRIILNTAEAIRIALGL